MNLSNVKEMNENELSLKACKMSLTEFKEVSVGSKYYSKQNLKRVFNTIYPEYTKKNINFLMSKGYIYLVPETGQGFEKDLSIMLKAMSAAS